MRRPRGPYAPPLVLGAIGIGLLGLGVWNLGRELSALVLRWGPLVAFGQITLPALAVVYASYRLLGSSFNGSERWRVVLFGVAGLLLVGGGLYTTIVVRLAEARAVGEPQYVLGVMSGLGAAGGAALGSLSVTSERDARQAERARDNFELLNSIIRHDILNSMMIVQSRAEFIEEQAEDDRVREFAATILAQSSDVVDQVERTRAILQALRASEPRLEATDLRATLEREAEAARATYDGVVVDLDLPEGPLHVRADDLLGDVVGNVVSNAVEHNDDAEPHVEVSATVEPVDDTVEGPEGDEVVELRIADDGPGIDDELKDAVFRRDETGLHEDGTGSGFGLFFVDTMMEKYAGTVRVEDNEPRGSVFVLRFAAADPAAESGQSVADAVEVPA